MRPPKFTGGNWSQLHELAIRPPYFSRFNEAAEIHRRKLQEGAREDRHVSASLRRFNEAAEIHRRKQIATAERGLRARCRTGFNEAAEIHRRKHGRLMMLTHVEDLRFNEAAEIHRRKRSVRGSRPRRGSELQ